MAQSEQEYRSLCSQRSTKQRQYNNYQSQNDTINSKLRRLRAAKSSVADLKSDFKSHKKKTEDILKSEASDWKGSTHDTYRDKGDILVEDEKAYYKNTLDYVLDSLNDEITRLENQRMSNLGIMGDLLSQINNLANRIENFFN